MLLHFLRSVLSAEQDPEQCQRAGGQILGLL